MFDERFLNRTNDDLVAYWQRLQAAYCPPLGFRGHQILDEWESRAIPICRLLRMQPKEWQEEWLELQRLLREIEQWTPPYERSPPSV